MKDETPKPITATDVLAVAAKSELLPSTLAHDDSTNQVKTKKNSYVYFEFYGNYFYDLFLQKIG